MFYASDVHGSRVCWKKFINAARFFDCQVLVMGGDMTGKMLVPIVAIACVGLCLSAVTRNSAAAVVGTLMFALLMQLIGILPGLSGLNPYLLSTQLSAWQGFFRVPTDWAPIVRGLWVSAAYALPALAAAYLVFLRRDVTGG